ncbi:MAG: DUF4440 domain-containing protein [Acidimicrobiia bacterium]|nr:DUF4440 domain-containing protein [Acidimicrobiia bacterium]
MTDEQRPGAANPGARPERNPDAEDVLAANQAFYDAFEAADLDAMSALWEHGDRVVCTHPGWPMLRGWGQVAASWFAIFGGPQRLQFILTDPVVEVLGDAAMVSVAENLLSGSAGSTVAALNVFVRSPEGWQLVAHHGSPVAGS